ncbi:MAG: lipase maturation factor family protein [Thermoanaerobaculia bacterium]|nr:lipase maturation factor family protein [Thermoanaerobaculia bacterium]
MPQKSGRKDTLFQVRISDRLDWLMWFAAMSTPEQYPWTLHLVWKLLHNDPGTLSLLASNPFPGEPPRFIRVRQFRYQFAPLGTPESVWWTRSEIGPWLPALSADDPRLVNLCDRKKDGTCSGARQVMLSRQIKTILTVWRFRRSPLLQRQSLQSLPRATPLSGHLCLGLRG